MSFDPYLHFQGNCRAAMTAYQGIFGGTLEVMGYAEAPDAPPIPVDWRSAIEAAKASAFLKDALGEDMHRTFTAIKAAEYARVARTVSEVDFDLYLHTV